MKNIILALTTCISVMTLAQNTKNNAQQEDLKGNVKSLRHTSYSVKDLFGKVEKDSIIEGNNYLFTFNKDGNFIETVYYTSDNKLDFKNIYIYNDKGQNTEINQYNNKKKLIGKFTYVYNDKGQNTEENTYNGEGELMNKYIYSYDKIGNLIESTNYYANKEKIQHIVSSYSKNNTITQQKETHYEDEYISVGKFEYNDQQKFIKSTWTRKDFNNEFISKIVYLFDEHENEIEAEYFNEKNKSEGKVVYIYEYDKYNNWIKKTTIDGFVTIEITERKITYYQ